MTIWIDDDACPRPVLEIALRAADRRGVDVCRVANRALAPHPSPRVRAVRVGGAFDAADRHIAAGVAPGDIVVTADVPLAAAVVAKGARALGPRGEEFTTDNVGDLLARRNLLEELRAAGLASGGPAPFGPKDRERFANALDRILTRPA